MESEQIPDIIKKTFVDSDLSKSDYLKSKSFWKEQLYAVINLIPEYGGFIAKEIEVIIDGISNYKDKELFRKFTLYIYGIADTDMSSRQKFAEEIEEKAKDSAGNVLMGMIDRLDNINKQTILANLTKSRINGDISIEDFFRLYTLLERIPYVDLNDLQKYKEDFYDSNGATEFLFSTGALQQSVIDADGDDKYVLSKLGLMLLIHGLRIDLPSTVKSNVKQINASNVPIIEEVSPDDVKNMLDPT